MARIARIVVPKCPHHITQRGNYKQITFDSDKDYHKYVSWLEYYKNKFGLGILAFCLMPNHIHLAAIPASNASMAKTLNVCHMRYSQYFNKKSNKTGHLWQGRFYSSPLDAPHLYSAIRYIENNPVRANLVKCAEDWKWSSVKAHLGEGTSPLSLVDIGRYIKIDNWKKYIMEKDDENTIHTIRSNTLTGRPCGDNIFIHDLEKTFGKRLRALPPGRPKNI